MGKNKKRKSPSPTPSDEETAHVSPKKQKRDQANSQENDEDDIIVSKKKLKEVKDILKNVEDSIKRLPKKKHVAAIFRKWQQTVYSKWSLSLHIKSWKVKRNLVLPRQYRQCIDNCWAVSLYRQWHILRKLKGLSTSKLTVDKIVEGVPLRYRYSKGGLKGNCLHHAIEFLKNGGYVDEVFIHKPHGDSEEKNFEKHLESLLLDGPLSVIIDSYPSYAEVQGNGFLSPKPAELERELYEIFPCHILPLLGHGVMKQEVDEPEEYWDLYESQGKYWGTDGFVRMARHHSLIKEAIEMKVNCEE